MAIYHAQTLLLPLLVSLFFLPAAFGETKFKTCNAGRHYPVDVKTVEISPDTVKSSTNANITIAGSTSIDIPDGATVKLTLSIGGFPVSKKSYSLCDIVACPVAPGPIVLNFFSVFTKKELKGRGYTVMISIKAEHQRESMMCVWFFCLIRQAAVLNYVPNILRI